MDIKESTPLAIQTLVKAAGGARPLSRLAGVSDHSIRQWAMGVRLPSGRLAVIAAEGLGIDYDELTGQKVIPKETLDRIARECRSDEGDDEKPLTRGDVIDIIRSEMPKMLEEALSNLNFGRKAI